MTVDRMTTNRLANKMKVTREDPGPPSEAKPVIWP